MTIISTQNAPRATAGLAALTGVLLIAALRIINIDGPALWTDEGFVYYTFTIDLFDALTGDRHPPFYFYTLHGWEALAGRSIFALRYWSFLPSMLTVALTAAIGRELLRHRPGIVAGYGALGLPVLAALMMALADAENYMAQELRMYTWQTFFAAGATWAYLRYWRRSTRFDAFLWGAFGVMGLYTHYFSAFVLIAHGLHALFALRGRARLGAVAVLAICGAIFAPWFALVTLEQFARDAVCVNCATSQNVEILLDFREKWFGQMWPLTIGLALLGLVAIRYAGDAVRVAWRPFGASALLLALIVIPVAGTFTLGHEEAVLLARRMVQITVPVALLLALGLANLRGMARGLLVAVLIVYGVTTIDWYRIKVPWHTITDLIAEYATADDLALMEVGFEESALLYYYDHQLPDGITVSRFPMWSDESRFDYYEIELPALLAEHAANADGVAGAWVTFFSPDDGILRRLEAAGYTRTMTRPFHHLDSVIDVYRYDALPDAPLTAFANGMTLYAAQIIEGDDLPRVDLWWSADAPLTREYVVSAYLMDADGRLIAQYDSPPQRGGRSTRTFAPAEVVYDPRPLAWADGIAPTPIDGARIGVRVYAFTSAGEIEIIPTADGDDSFFFQHE